MMAYNNNNNNNNNITTNTTNTENTRSFTEPQQENSKPGLSSHHPQLERKTWSLRRRRKRRDESTRAREHENCVHINRQTSLLVVRVGMALLMLILISSFGVSLGTSAAVVQVNSSLATGPGSFEDAVLNANDYDIIVFSKSND